MSPLEFILIEAGAVEKLSGCAWSTPPLLVQAAFDSEARSEGSASPGSLSPRELSASLSYFLRAPEDQSLWVCGLQKAALASRNPEAYTNFLL